MAIVDDGEILEIEVVYDSSGRNRNTSPATVLVDPRRQEISGRDEEYGITIMQEKRSAKKTPSPYSATGTAAIIKSPSSTTSENESFYTPRPSPCPSLDTTDDTAQPPRSTTNAVNERSNAIDPSSMSTPELKKECQSLGIDTTNFLEKSELINALINARKELKTVSVVDADAKLTQQNKRSNEEGSSNDDDDESTKIVFDEQSNTNNNNSEISRRLVEYFVVVSSVPKKVMGGNGVTLTNSDVLLSSVTNADQGKNNNIPSPLRRNQSSQVAAARMDIRRAHLGRFHSEGMGVNGSISSSNGRGGGGASAAAASFKNLEKKLENMKLDKTLTKLKKTMANSRPLTPTSMIKGDNKKRRGVEDQKNHQQQPFDEVNESFSSEGSSVSMDVVNNVNVEGGSTFQPSFIVPASPPPPIPPISSAGSEEKSTTPRIAPLPERKTASSAQGGGGLSENIRLDNDDTLNQQQHGNNNNDGSSLSNCILEPIITAQYPPVDHINQPLNPMITKFCYPQGDVIVPSRTYKMPTVHHFVLTDSRGGKMYGTCLTAYEEYKHRRIEIDIGDSTISTGGDTIKTPTRRKITKDDNNGDCGYVELSANGSPDAKPTRRTTEHTYYAPRVLCLLSTWPYLSAFRTYLTQLYRLATTTNIMVAPLERYILNICSEVPAPPPGSFRVNLSILNTKIGFWSPPADQPIPYVSLPYGILFECLDIGNVLFVWYTLACERKVLLVSSQLSLLTVCAEILCSMLFPLRWSHLYIPCLPRFLTPMLDAPMPYLIGISREVFPSAVADISDDTVVVDLDRNVITMGATTPELPIIPQRRKIKLEETLEKYSGEVFWNARGLKTSQIQEARQSGDKELLDKLLCKADTVWDEKIHSMDDAFEHAPSPHSIDLMYMDGASSPGPSKWDAVQEAFLRFYVSMLKDYRKFMPSSSQTNSRSSWRSLGSVETAQFQSTEFVNSQLPDYQPFLEELIGTQQFDDFVTRRMYNACKAPDVTFFDQSIDAKRNRSKLNLKKVRTNFLHSANAHRNLKQIDAIPPNKANLPPRSASDVYYDMKKGSYTYPTWPESFNQSLFCTPRPIPKIITAEFDRRSALTAMLADHGTSSTATRRVAGSNNLSPETTAFVLFFVTFSCTIGKEWSQLVQRNANALDDSLDTGSIDSSKSGRPWKPKVNPPWMDGETFHSLHSTFHPPSKLDPPESGETVHEDTIPDDICDPDCINLCNSFGNALDPLSFPDNPWTRSSEENNVPVQQLGTARPNIEELGAVIEKARAIAKAQIDFGVNTLIMMRKRRLPTESITYKTLIEACGRCGIAHRAEQLMEMMTQDGLALDPEVYYEYIKAFSNADMEGSFTSNKELDTTSVVSTIHSHPSGTFSNLNVSLDSSNAMIAWAHPAVKMQFEAEELAEQSITAMKRGSTKFMTGIQKAVSSTIAANRRAFKNAKTKQKKLHSKHNFTKKDDLRVTDAIATHLTLSQCILQDLYNGIKIDTDSDSCPKCSNILDQDSVISGWKPCQVKDYTTMCPSCQFRFVPKFSVSCNLDSFEGSQGMGTPLYCDYLSPWVLLREIRSLLTASVGGKASKVLGAEIRDEPLSIDRLIDPNFRVGNGINATLWWNMIVTFTRFKIPFTYLLQGSYKDQQLIMPYIDDDI